jgi:hypothetical protein
MESGFADKVEDLKQTTVKNKYKIYSSLCIVRFTLSEF